jgi:hypothetical protein
MILCVLQRPHTTDITLPVEAVQISMLHEAHLTGVKPTCATFFADVINL